MNSRRNANNWKLMTLLPDPEHYFKFGNLMKTQFFDKTTLFITYRNKYIVTKYIYSS